MRLTNHNSTRKRNHMESTKSIIFPAISLLLLFSFSIGSWGQRKSNPVRFTLDNIKCEKLESFIPLEKVELGDPRRITFYNKNNVIITDRKSRAAVVLIDLQSGKVVDSLLRGRGPGECLRPYAVTVSGGDVYIDDSVMGQKVIVTHPHKGRVLSFDHETIMDGYYLGVAPLPKGGYIGLPNKGSRFERIDEKGLPQGSFGSFPPIKGDKKSITNSAAQSRFAISPDGKHLCSSFLMMDYIEIYSDGFRSLVRLWGPEADVPNVRVSGDASAGMSWSVLEPPKRVFSSVCASNEGFIVGYYGDMKDRSFAEAYTRYLLLFDWSGKCLKMIELPMEVLSFDIDWADGRIIALSKDADPKILVASIKQFL